MNRMIALALAATLGLAAPVTAAVRGGTNASDRITGAGGADVIRGEGGRDRLDGRGGADRLYGGAKDDILRGGAGADRLDGGTGKDDRVTADRSDRVAADCETVNRR